MVQACFDGLLIEDFERLPIPVQIDLICCFASYVSTTMYAGGLKEQLVDQLRERAVIMLTVVSIILHEPGPFLVDGLSALAILLEIPFVCHLTTKRHRIVMALQKYLCDEEAHEEVRIRAMSCIRLMVSGMGSSTPVNQPMVQLIRALCNRSPSERNPAIQLAMVRSMECVCEAPHLLYFPQEATMALLRKGDSINRELADVAAKMFLRTIAVRSRRDQSLTPSCDQLSFIVGLLASQHTAVRLQSLRYLEAMSFRKPERVAYLLQKTSCLNHLSGALKFGQCSETRRIVAFCKQASFALENLTTMGCHIEFVEALVAAVSLGDGDTSRGSLDILCLLALHRGTAQPMQKMLPWFVRLANTTSSDTIKTQLVGAISALSQSCIDSL